MLNSNAKPKDTWHPLEVIVPAANTQVMLAVRKSDTTLEDCNPVVSIKRRICLSTTIVDRTSDPTSDEAIGDYRMHSHKL